MTHMPPYRALEAFHVGRLRASHRALVETHLSHCESCRIALASIGAYERVSGEVRAIEPALDWARINARVAREIGRKQRDRRIALTACGIVAFAAAALLMTRPRPQPVVMAPRQEALPTETPTTPAVTVSAGEARLDGTLLSAREPRERRLHDGSTLRTAQGSLHVDLAPGTSFDLDSGTELTVASMRAPTRLVLGAGRITSEVRPGTPYEVAAGPYLIRVRGTRFDVEHNGDRVAVHLHSGRVEVIENGTSLGILVAPATWTSPDTSTPGPAADPRVTSRGRATPATVVMEAPDATTPPESSDEADVAESMRSQAGSLRRCIAQDATPVSFTIHFSVGAMGTIRDVSLSSRSEIPTEVSDCVLQTVQRFRVPAPDDPVDLSLPMTLP